MNEEKCMGCSSFHKCIDVALKEEIVECDNFATITGGANEMMSDIKKFVDQLVWASGDFEFKVAEDR